MVKEVQLTRGYVALIDDDDFERVSQYTWYCDFCEGLIYARAYVSGSHRGASIALHRLIMNAPQGQQVDHRNRDGLDCRRSNLRLANASQQQSNRVMPKGPSGFRGVRKKSRGSTFEARIQVDGKTISTYRHRTAEEAARSYDAMARFHHGEFARLNFPSESEQAA